MSISSRNILKLLTISCLLVLVVALLIAWANPAAGYELDIYRSTPILTWIFLALAMLGGAYIVIQQAVTKGYETSRVWLLGLLVLVISRFAFLYIPYIRGYVTWGGDNIDHWGFLKDVINTGHFHPENYYPITHSIISQTSTVSDMPLQYISNLSTAFMSVLFIITIYLLATAVLTRKVQQLLAVVIAGVVMVEGGYNVFLMPNGWSILMLPLLFYFYFKRRANPAYTFLLVLLLIMYPFFHPLSGLVIVLAFIVFIVLRITYKLWYTRRGISIASGDLRSLLALLMLEAAVLITWILSFNSFRPNIQLIWEQITSGGSDILGGMGETLSRINMHGFDVVILFVKLYGMQTILIILSLIGIVLLIRQQRRAENRQSLAHCTGVAVLFLFCGFLYVLYYLGVPGLSSIGATRMLAYTMMFTPILAALSLYKLSQVFKYNTLTFGLTLIVLLVPSILSLMGLYQSPYTINPNGQIARQDMAGMTWVVNKKDMGIICAEIMSPVDEYADGILGAIEADKRRDIYAEQFADHFGYNEYNSVGEQYSQDLYAAITKKDRIIYSTVWQEVGRFSEADFTQLEEDITINRLYTNGELVTYYVRAIESE